MYPEAMKATFQIENPTYHAKVQRFNIIIYYFFLQEIDCYTCIINFIEIKSQLIQLNLSYNQCIEKKHKSALRSCEPTAIVK